MAVRLGLCCGFVAEPVRFRTTTVRYASTLRPRERRVFLTSLALDNAHALGESIDWCLAQRPLGVGAFRINSAFWPLITHARLGYDLDALDPDGELRDLLEAIRVRARRGRLRLSLHPDQFVVLGSATPRVARFAAAELEYQAELAELVGAEQLTIHGGGAQGGKEAALARLARGLERLSPRARALVAVENDEVLYAPRDLLPFCQATAVPLVYDVHHHRCLPDGLTIAEATAAAARTWGRREPWAHISSPRGGWRGPTRRAHADFIAPSDFPTEWLGRRMTVDVEAKAKEHAVLRLARWLARAQRRQA